MCAILQNARGRATYRLVVEYDGTAFCGFQFQPELRTIGGELETALRRAFAEPVKVTCAGRTDAGVHALGQVVSFTAHDRFPIGQLAVALNSALPPDISVRECARVLGGFSARRDASERRYVYVVLARRERSAALVHRAHHERRPLDLVRMRAGAARLVGRHDFRAFCGVPPDRGGTTVRTLYELDIEDDAPLVRFRVCGKGFLHRMVRILVGTLLEIGAGRREPEEIDHILASRDRRRAGATASAGGLYFVGARYEGFDSAPPDAAFPLTGRRVVPPGPRVLRPSSV